MKRRALLAVGGATLAGTLGGCLFGNEEPEDPGIPGFDEERFLAELEAAGLEGSISRLMDIGDLDLSYETTAETEEEHEEDVEAVVEAFTVAIEDPETFYQVGYVRTQAFGPGADNELQYTLEAQWLIDVYDGELSAATVAEQALADEADLEVAWFDTDDFESTMGEAALEVATLDHEAGDLSVGYESPGSREIDLEAEASHVIGAVASAVEAPDDFDGAVAVVFVTAMASGGPAQLGYSVEAADVLAVVSGDQTAEDVAETALADT